MRSIIVSSPTFLTSKIYPHDFHPRQIHMKQFEIKALCLPLVILRAFSTFIIIMHDIRSTAFWLFVCMLRSSISNLLINNYSFYFDIFDVVYANTINLRSNQIWARVQRAQNDVNQMWRKRKHEIIKSYNQQNQPIKSHGTMWSLMTHFWYWLMMLYRVLLAFAWHANYFPCIRLTFDRRGKKTLYSILEFNCPYSKVYSLHTARISTIESYSRQLYNKMWNIHIFQPTKTKQLENILKLILKSSTFKLNTQKIVNVHEIGS